MTTDNQDIAALYRAIIELLHTPEFDDMAWPEIQAALNYVMHEVRIVSMHYGTFNNAPTDPEPPPEARRG